MDESQIYLTTLKNGIRIVCESMPSYSSVSFGVWVGAGSIYENEDERGISHFIEHMLFKGTNSRSAKDIATEMDAIGAQSNAFTSKNCTCFYATALGSDLEKVVDIISDMIYGSKFAESEMEREKSVVCEEILMTEDTPDDLAFERLGSLMYNEMPIAYPILGTDKSVRAISRDGILKYMARTYVPQNMVIACAGNFDRDKLISLVEKTFGAEAAPAPAYRESSFPQGKRKFSSVKKDVEQAHICIGLPGCPSDTELHFPLIVVSNIFGGSMSSRLFQNIREKQGLAYSVYSHVMSYKDVGSFSMYAGTGASSAQRVTQSMLDELAKLRDKGITESELERSKNQLKNGYLLGLESTSAHSSALGKKMLIYDKLFSPSDSVERIDSVTKEDCRKAIECITDFDSMSCVIVGKNNKELNTDVIKKIVTEYN